MPHAKFIISFNSRETKTTNEHILQSQNAKNSRPSKGRESNYLAIPPNVYKQLTLSISSSTALQLIL